MDANLFADLVLDFRDGHRIGVTHAMALQLSGFYAFADFIRLIAEACAAVFQGKDWLRVLEFMPLVVDIDFGRPRKTGPNLNGTDIQ